MAAERRQQQQQSQALLPGDHVRVCDPTTYLPVPDDHAWSGVWRVVRVNPKTISIKQGARTGKANRAVLKKTDEPLPETAERGGGADDQVLKRGGGADDRVLNTIDAAELLGVDRKILSKWAKQGKVPSRKPGKSYLYSRAALFTWLGGGGADDQVLNTAEAAAFLGVDPKLLSKWAKAGKVPSQKPGKGYLYSKNALLRWLAGDLEVPGPPASDNGQQPPRTARATRGRGRAARASSRQGQ